MTEKDVYQFYNDTVKVIFSEIEARRNTLPVELLFEIHSAFDHLKRIYIDNESEEIQSQKAYSHLKRGCLDAFKLKLKYFNSDAMALYNKKTDLRIVDNGTFLVDFIKSKSEIFKIAKEARLNEGKKQGDEAFEKWYQVSLMIDSFEEKFFDHKKIQWAQKQSFFKFLGSFIRAEGLIPRRLRRIKGIKSDCNTFYEPTYLAACGEVVDYWYCNRHNWEYYRLANH